MTDLSTIRPGTILRLHRDRGEPEEVIIDRVRFHGRWGVVVWWRDDAGMLHLERVTAHNVDIVEV